MDAEMRDAHGAEAEDGTLGEDVPLPLSDKESKILDLYDQLLKLEFEVALRKELQSATIGIFHFFCSHYVQSLM